MICVEKINENTTKYYSPAFDVITHGRSGSYTSFSRKSNILSLLYKSKWYLDNNLNELIARRNNENAVNEEFMWGLESDQFFVLKNNELFLMSSSNSILYKKTLPNPIKGPGLSKDEVYVQWRTGNCAGENLQYIEGYAIIHGEEHIYTMFLDGTGWWYYDVTNGDTKSPHNSYSWNNGIRYCPKQLLKTRNIFGSNSSSLEFYISKQGTESYLLEPLSVSNSWTHPAGRSNSDMLWVGNNINGGIECVGKVYWKETDVRSQCRLNDWCMWHHGDVHGNECIFSLLSYKEGKSLFEGIYKANIDTLKIDCVYKCPNPYDVNKLSFLGQPRPTWSWDKKYIAWHHQENDNDAISVIKMRLEEKPISEWECVITKKNDDVVLCNVYSNKDRTIESWEIKIPENKFNEGDILNISKKY